MCQLMPYSTFKEESDNIKYLLNGAWSGEDAGEEYWCLSLTGYPEPYLFMDPLHQ